jgi:hypothetical protein
MTQLWRENIIMPQMCVPPRTLMLSMLCMSQLGTGLPINTQWFMQYGAAQHIANIDSDFFPDTSGPSVISGQ